MCCCLFVGLNFKKEHVAGANAAKAESGHSRKVKATILNAERSSNKKRFEKKKQERLRYEKILSLAMEGFVTRSALDRDMTFTLDPEQVLAYSRLLVGWFVNHYVVFVRDLGFHSMADRYPLVTWSCA